ncbi:MAG: flavin reductase family protein [Rubrivivax sp.]|nr:flavin reductase family protein [Rubrivivax sp.]
MNPPTEHALPHGNLAAVALPQAYRLMNHGPTVLVSASHAGRRNVMAAAWAMPLDFDPPKVAVVIDKATFTRGLVEGSQRFALSLPCRDIADLAYTVGCESAHEGIDKFARHGIGCLIGTEPSLPLIAGCVAWLECRVLPRPAIEQAHDLFLGEVTAAWADTRVFREGRWQFSEAHAGLRTLHHVAGGAFFSPADLMQANRLT